MGAGGPAGALTPRAAKPGQLPRSAASALGDAGLRASSCLSQPLPQPVKVMEVLPRLTFCSFSPLVPAAGRSPPGARRWRRALREMAAGPGWLTDLRDSRRFCPAPPWSSCGRGLVVYRYFNYFFIFGANSNKSSAPAGMLHSRARLGDPRHTQTRTDGPSPASRRPRNGAVPPPAGERGSGRERRGGEEGRGERKRNNKKPGADLPQPRRQ